MGQTGSNTQGHIQRHGAGNPAARHSFTAASPAVVLGLILALPCSALMAAVGQGPTPPTPLAPDRVQGLAAAFFIAPPAAPKQPTERVPAEAVIDTRPRTVVSAPPVPAPLAPEAIRRLAGSLQDSARPMAVAAPPVSPAPSSPPPPDEGGSAAGSDDPAAGASPAGPPTGDSKQAPAEIGEVAIGRESAGGVLEEAPPMASMPPPSQSARSGQPGVQIWPPHEPMAPQPQGAAVQIWPPASPPPGTSAAMPPTPGQHAVPAVGLSPPEGAPSTAGAGAQATSRMPLDPAKVDELAIDMATATQAIPAPLPPAPEPAAAAPSGMRPLPPAQMDMVRGVFDPEP